MPFTHCYFIFFSDLDSVTTSNKGKKLGLLPFSCFFSVIKNNIDDDYESNDILDYYYYCHCFVHHYHRQ